MSLPQIEGFIVVEKIGAGSYATVYKGYRKGSHRECVAVKCIERSSLKGSAVDNLITEIRLLKSLTHPHIVTMKDFLWDDKNIYIIMEYCNYGDLSKYVKRERGIDEKLCRRLLRQLALALQLLREKGIVHMDLKPQNLLLHKTPEGKIILKVGDFGFAQYMSEETRAKNMRGSPLYMAPEVFSIGIQKNVQSSSTNNTTGYDASVDLWSVGIILYECLFGKAPYSSSTYKELVDKILSHKTIEIPSGYGISSDCRDLISRLLQHDPKKRISYEEFFQHPFLDMKHMPSPENYKKAADLIQQAIEKDSSCDYEAAYHLYCESLRYFVPMVLEETGAEANSLRTKVNCYIKRAEELKLYTVGGLHGASPSNSRKSKPEESSPNSLSNKRSPKKCSEMHNDNESTNGSEGTSSSVPNLISNFSKGVAVSENISRRNVAALQNDKSVIFKNSETIDSNNIPSEVDVTEELPCAGHSNCVKTKADFDKLYSVCLPTYQLRIGLDVGKDAEMYVRDGRLEEALSLYRSAISILLKGCQTEPQGPRRAMLRDKIDEWLKEAESIKSLLESREMQLQQNLAEDSHKEQCCVQ